MDTHLGTYLPINTYLGTYISCADATSKYLSILKYQGLYKYVHIKSLVSIYYTYINYIRYLLYILIFIFYPVYALVSAGTAAAARHRHWQHISVSSFDGRWWHRSAAAATHRPAARRWRAVDGGGDDR